MTYAGLERMNVNSSLPEPYAPVITVTGESKSISGFTAISEALVTQ